MTKEKFIESINTYGAEKVDGRVRWAKNSRVRSALMKSTTNGGKIYFFSRKEIRHMRFETDLSSDITQFLIACGIPYSTGNDAPRGGKEGNYILVNLRG